MNCSDAIADGRENIDPEGICSDAQLNDFLQAVITDPATSPSLREKLRLDGMIENEGVNYSTGERQICEYGLSGFTSRNSFQWFSSEPW